MALTPWVVIASSRTAYSKPADNDLLTDSRDRNDHLQGFLYDKTKHVPIKAHDHDDLNSAKVAVPRMANLILDGRPTQGWSLTGASFVTNGMSFSATGQRGTRQLLDDNTGAGFAARAVNAFGANGCKLLVAMVARIVGSVTAAGFRVGFADGDAVPASAQGRFSFDQADLSAPWTRVYGIWTPFVPGGAWTALRVSVETFGTWTGAGTIEVDYVLVKPSSRLCYWQPAYVESRFESGGNMQQGDASIYDQALNFTDAVPKTVA